MPNLSQMVTQTYTPISNVALSTLSLHPGIVKLLFLPVKWAVCDILRYYMF